MMLALLLVVVMMVLLLLLRKLMVMVVMMVMVMVQWGRGRRGRSQSRSTWTGGRAAGTSAERRRRLHRLHLRLHQGGENGLEARHFHAAAAAIVRRHRFVGDVRSRWRHRHRHLFACLGRRRHVTSLIGGDRGNRRRATAIGCGAGTIGPLPKRSQTLLFPFRRGGTPVVCWWQFLQEARQHQTCHQLLDRRQKESVREPRQSCFPLGRGFLIGYYRSNVIPPTAPFINLPQDFRATLLTIFFPGNDNSYKPHKSW